MLTTLRPQGWTASQLLQTTGGRLVCGDMEAPFETVSLDSRKIRSGALFVAIRGETHDGHQFVKSALDQGVAVVMVDEAGLSGLSIESWTDREFACVAVADTVNALGAFAAWHRQCIDPRVVAITGSNGKTTTRRMTAAVLKQQFQTHSTRGNFNNEIGLPVTLLQLEPSHQWAAIELGMNHFGEISRLSRISRPDIGIITNIAASHLEGVGDPDGVLKAKTELIDGMAADAPLLLNGEDPRLRAWGQSINRKTIYWGESERCLIQAKNVRQTGYSLQFDLVLEKERAAVALQTPGRVMAQNALAAAGTGWLAGIPIHRIVAGLASFQPKPGRLQIVTTATGITILDDTYNANPGSMAQALDTLTALAPSNKAAAVLGDMLELGAQSAVYHHQIGEMVAQKKVAFLCATGQEASHVADGALSAGLSHNQIVVGTKAEIVEKLKQTVTPGFWVLFKGSRGMTMETALTPFLQWADEKREV